MIIKSKDSVIWRESGKYCSFPHAAILPNGNLAVVFRRASKFSADSAVKGVATHHDPDSEILFMESDDMGETWLNGNARRVYKSSYGVNDPAMTILKDNTILIRFVALEISTSNRFVAGQKKLFSHRTEHGLVTTVVGNIVMASNDNGVSWSEIGVANCSSIGPSCSRDPIVEMTDGSWLMPVYTGAPQRSDISWVIRSFDHGKNWCEPIRIMSDEAGRNSQLQGINYNETSLLALGNGELLAMVRADGAFHTDNEFMPVGGVGTLCTARSYDGGLSWTSPVSTGIWGQPGSLLKLVDGRLLCTYGYRRKPYGVRACLSSDGGKTWDVKNELIIRDDCPVWDCGYPFSVQLPNGSIFTVYYFVDGELTRFIAGTTWELP